MAGETEQLTFLCELENIGGGEFKSSYCLNDKPILPPVMNDWKRLEMMRLRLCALTKEVVQKRNQITRPERKDASTNTNTQQGFAPLVIMGRFRQKLEQSETKICDHTANMVLQISAPLPKPIGMTSQLVMEDASLTPPQRAVVKVTPVKLATAESGWVTKLDPPKAENPKPRELSVEPLHRSTTSPDLAKLHHQMWRRDLTKRPLPQLTLLIKSDLQIGQQIGKQPPNKPTTTRNPSRIPKLVAIRQVTNNASVTKTQSAYQARRSCDTKVTAKRTNQVTKGQVFAVKQKAPPNTTHLNVPKSIRTPVPSYKRPGYVQDELQLQRNLFKSLILRQAEENKRMQAKMQQQQQGLIATMMNDLNHAVEISNDLSVDGSLHLDSSTSSDPSQQ
ncbi:uncharacterized protein LOC6555157 [Drosophila erecta]|uniref:GG11920 n=1 Tax=Drosophila erecta TaxID=7220 RepID=B3P555_DROER|nr:uncharacterized protein LOC6555157 [Drosophila erecta]EDV53038.1 uncharacterized protein Dere_GG11920 [Drosophila erecta]